MAEYDNQQRNQLSRAIANNEPKTKQFVGFVDNRQSSRNLGSIVSVLQRICIDPIPQETLLKGDNAFTRDMSINVCANRAESILSITNWGEIDGKQSYSIDWSKTEEQKATKVEPYNVRTITAYYDATNAIVRMAMAFHYGPDQNGYVIEVEDNGIIKKMSSKWPNALEADEFSDLHLQANQNLGFDDTQILINTISQNYDSYTKLAGEGARFNCVKNHQQNLANDSNFLAPTKKWTFMKLWNSWGREFSCEFGIPNSKVSEAIEKGRFSDYTPSFTPTSKDFLLSKDRAFSPGDKWPESGT